ncbi:hypothetical protein ACFFS2_34815 [Streptomyces aurantiacus]|uniref:Uncharacterized protein n=1 Tax=Streptomyces aurantiacus TaxID=47760 RepID=A0A7G1PF74_9ACTN|nr:hypothetical protein [Streptomyces aurantiacus]BCL32260.1 hypothetical protein GCM10017557_71190 [Streptomyces aurantiacus]
MSPHPRNCATSRRIPGRASPRSTTTIPTAASESRPPQLNSYYSPAYSCADGARWKLEDRLGHFLRDLDQVAVHAEQRSIPKEEEEAARKRNWYKALRQARTAQITQHRGAVLTGQVERWRLAEDIRAFCSAARRADVAADWTQWAEQYATSIDSLAYALAVPADPPAAPHDLRDCFRGDTYAYPWPFGKDGTRLCGCQPATGQPQVSDCRISPGMPLFQPADTCSHRCATPAAAAAPNSPAATASSCPRRRVLRAFEARIGGDSDHGGCVAGLTM